MPEPDPPEADRVLFVGNSFVTRNDLPAMVSRLATAAGHQLAYRSVVAGGASLRRHLNSGAIQSALAQARWDQVVLQEQSTLPVKNAARYHDNVRAVHALTRVAGARTVLYMTWARRSVPQAQQQLAAAVQTIAAEIGAAVAPAGLAWQTVVREHPEISLHAADGSHPTVAGSWLAACVIYRTLFRDPGLPPSTPHPDLDPEVAAVLAEAACRVTV